MSFTKAPDLATRPTLRGHYGMAASTHWLATAAAQSVLERGGNAFDAAAAGGFVLHIVEPHLNGPGGDMPAIFATAEDPQPRVLMGQGPAPAKASTEYYQSLGMDSVPGAGGLAAAVPAATEAWLALVRDHGVLPLSEVLEYAISYAEEGHAVLPRVVQTLPGLKELFEEHWPTSANHWLPGGEAPKPWQVITNPAYGALLREMAEAPGDSREDQIEAARKIWKQKLGAAVEKNLETPHRHADGKDYAPVITAADIDEFTPSYEEAATITFRGYTIAKTGPWGQGPALLQALKILEGYEDHQLDPSTEEGVHLISEAIKLAFADRDTYYGDTEVNLEYLLSEEYAATRRALITEKASTEFRPGDLPGVDKILPPLQEGSPSPGTAPAGTGEPTVAKTGETKGDTCHIDIVDAAGNIISATPSGGWLQSSPHLPEVGFPLGTRLQMNLLEPGHPATLAPGKRPRTTLTPTLVLKDGKPIIALGTPGGDQQEQWQLPMLLRVLIGGYTLQEAIDAPNFHTTSILGSFYPRTIEPGGLVVEDRLGDEVISGLEARGHKVKRAGDWALGRLSAVSRDPETGQLHAGANPRGDQGYAAGR
ncbi:transferase [Nesterenkonia sp. MY13]|uniref:Transferase n=1 Tax=Nesterenkonia sedimenti TaxID=1463632 RepID=A0A7X8TKN1_9MICC|nr:gamma-glutamyltransferase [Nesterenkonia sedimenti]NLS10304.1 transferase [Nesterenkonia sedimenti]